jgi:pSer/pThr/pTyr-binding forkhead associated (FHA) protein
VFELSPLPQRIGRGPEATIPLDADLNVSRSHAEVYEWKGLLRIRDLGSTHGTLINGVPVTDQSFNLGDHVSVGGTLLVLRELP